MNGPPPSMGIFVLLLSVIVVPIVWSLVQAGRKRELEHRERMKALEMGISLPIDRAWAAGACIAIGAVVPVGALIVALIASLNAPRFMQNGGEFVPWTPEQSAVYFGCVWGATISIGVVSVIGGSLLSWFLLGRGMNRAASSMTHGSRSAKPAFDPDEYDTVASRG